MIGYMQGRETPGEEGHRANSPGAQGTLFCRSLTEATLLQAEKGKVQGGSLPPPPRPHPPNTPIRGLVGHEIMTVGGGVCAETSHPTGCLSCPCKVSTKGQERQELTQVNLQFLCARDCAKCVQYTSP